MTISIISEITRRETPLHITIPILILPDSPPPPPILSPYPRRSEKQREVETHRYHQDWNAEEGAVPAYDESITPSSPPPNIGESSTSSSSFFRSYARTGDEIFAESGVGRAVYIDNYGVEEGEQEEQEEEEEYDGYEELSASLSDIIPPPRIDEDCSPPSVSDANISASDNLSSLEDESILPSFEDVVPHHSYSNNNLVGQTRDEGSEVEDAEEEEIHPPSFAEVVQVSPHHHLTSTTSRVSLRSSHHEEVEEVDDHVLPTFSASTSSNSTQARPTSSHSLASSTIPTSTVETQTTASEISTNSNGTITLPPPPPYVNLNSLPGGTSEVVSRVEIIGGTTGISGPPPYLY